MVDISFETIAKALDSTRLHLIIMPTEKCNLRCVYCYEDFVQGRMKSSTIEGIKTLITSRKADLKNIEIGWFGGEPLLAKSVIEEIGTHVAEMVKSSPNPIVLNSSISTNGTLLDIGTLEKLTRLGVSTYQISLDGSQSDHDKTRISVSGQGTFDKIWRNLLAAQSTDLDFKIALRIHVHMQNIRNVSTLIEKIVAQFSGDVRFSAYIKSVENLGEDSQKDLRLLFREEKDILIKPLEQALVRSNLLRLDDDRLNRSCYASHANSFVIRSDGRVAKCTVAFNDKRNDIGVLNGDGTLTIDNEKFYKWIEGLLIGDKKATKCPAGRVLSNGQIEIKFFNKKTYLTSLSTDQY